MDDLLKPHRSDAELPVTVSAAEAAAHVAKGGAGTVIDVRSGVERDAEHVAGSLWIPLGRLGERLDDVRATPAPRLLLCRSGKRAEAAREQLERAQVRGSSVIEGGLLAYVDAGGDVVRGASRMSLERQVRVAAGSLVLLGLALALTLHPAFAGLSAFVGAGLVFAGVTDWCGMGLLLARAPWNRGSGDAGAAPGAASAGAPPVARSATQPPG